MKICSIKNCSGKIEARGWCKKHYGRWWKYGHPLKTLRRTERHEAFKFLQAILLKPLPKKCINWPFALGGGGYGSITINGRSQGAHRAMWTLAYGKIPKGKYICHAPIICHNKLCVNPNHLRIDTSFGNCKDKKLDGTDNYLRGEALPGTKLKAHQVRKIRVDKRMHKAIAKEYRISKSQVWNIKHFKTWKHLL